MRNREARRVDPCATYTSLILSLGIVGAVLYVISLDEGSDINIFTNQHGQERQHFDFTLIMGVSLGCLLMLTLPKLIQEFLDIVTNSQPRLPRGNQLRRTVQGPSVQPDNTTRTGPRTFDRRSGQPTTSGNDGKDPSSQTSSSSASDQPQGPAG